MTRKTKYQRRIKITSKMLICLVIVCVLFFSFLINGNINYKHDENSEKFSKDLKMSGLGWTTTEVVSTESIGNSWYPSITVDGAGNAHVAWFDDTDYVGSGADVDIFYKRWNATSNTWTTTEVVSTESTNSSWYSSIAVDDVGNVHVAWSDYTSYDNSGTDADIFYKRWNTVSNTWTTTEVVSTESTGNSRDPSIMVDGVGNAHVAWFDGTNYYGSGTDRDIFYKRWNATSNTWTTTEVVSTESTDNSRDPSIAVDGVGNAHVAWEEMTNYSSSGADEDIFYKRWNATSNTWTTTEVVSTESTDSSYFPSIVVDSAGNAHVAWTDATNYGTGTGLDIFYKRWNATSNTWTTTEVVSTESTGNSEESSIAVDGVGNVHVAWHVDYDGLGADEDIFYKRWNPNSSTWTTTEVVSIESTVDSEDPSIAVDDVGNAHVVWHDLTDYGGSGTDWDIFYKRNNLTSEILINSPISTSTWQMGNSYDILWNSISSIINVEIELYWKGTFNATISASTPNNGSYSWTVPSGLVNSTQYQIKITDVSNSSIYDFSNYFEIYTPYTPVESITVTNPSGIVIWETGTTHVITWTSTGSISNVRIALYENNIYNIEIVVSTPNDGEFSWTIPSGLAISNQYQIKITDVSNSSIYDFSNYFEIYTPYTPVESITVTNPSGIVIWETGTTHVITWTSTGSISNVRIALYENNIYNIEIVVSTPNDGEFSWTIPSGLAISNQYQIKIIDVSNSSTYDFSESFALADQPPSLESLLSKTEIYSAFGHSITLNLSLFSSTPHNNDVLNGWNVESDEGYDLKLGIMLEIYNLRSELESLPVPQFLLDYCDLIISDDDAIRFLITANVISGYNKSFDEFSLDVRDIIEALLLIISNPNNKISFPASKRWFFDHPIVKQWFHITKGTNQYELKLKGLVDNPIMAVLNVLDIFFRIDFQLLTYQGGEVIPARIGSHDLISAASFAFDIIKLCTKAVRIAGTAGADLLAWGQALGTSYRLFHKFIFDPPMILKTILDSVFPGLHDTIYDIFDEMEDISNWIYVGASFLDPPAARLDLALFDNESNLLLGYDPNSNSTIQSSEQGFVVGDQNAQFMLIYNNSNEVYDLKVINSDLDGVDNSHLNYSIILKQIGSNKTFHSEGYLREGESTSTLLQMPTETQPFSVNTLKITLLSNKYPEIQIWISDQNNNSVEIDSIEMYLNGEDISFEFKYEGNGIYMLSDFANSYNENKTFQIIVKKATYFMNLISVNFSPITGEQGTLSIPGYYLFILLGSLCLVILTTKKQFKNYL